jgi:hypothetical protein
MNFDSIFQAYYSLYRGDSDVPASTDTEYIVGMRLANEAINYWANYDNTFWNELWTENSLSTNIAGQTVINGQASYPLPADYKDIGGYIQLVGPTGVTYRIPRIEPNQVQFQRDLATYAYIADGQLHLNPVPNADIAGFAINYGYYKQPTYFTIGTSVTEMSNPYFIVHRMLGQQFRISRNPYYQSAIRDAEDAIRKMQLENNSGSWDNPWQDTDNSGSVWGVGGW